MRIFRKGKGTGVASLLNIIGLTAAFAAFYIILVQVRHDLMWNRGIQDHGRIYCVSMPDGYHEGAYTTFLNRPLMEKVIADVAAIEAGGTSYLKGEEIDYFLPSSEISRGADGKPNFGDMALSEITSLFDRKVEIRESMFSKGAKEVFGLKLVRGSWDAMVNGSKFAVSESTAERLGLDIGSLLLSRDFRGNTTGGEVVAIFKDTPSNTDLETVDLFYDICDDNIDDWSEYSYPYFFKAAPETGKEELETACKEVIGRILKDQIQEDEYDDERLQKLLDRYKPHLVPIADSYFDRTLRGVGASGNKTTTMTLLGIAILVIIIALINFINFFFALIPVRMRSLNTKKILGSGRASLMMEIISESVLLVLVSLVMAAVLVRAFQTSSAASLITASTAFGRNIPVIALTVLIALGVGVAASIYPALYITSFNPAFALKGSFGATARGQQLRYTLVGLQFFISMALIICAMFINLQRKYLLDRDLGFNQERLLVTRTNQNIAGSREVVGDELLNNHDIEAVSWADGDMVRPSRMGWGRTFKDRRINFECYPVGWDFLRFMGIEITEGRDFSRSDELSETGVFIFNETAKGEFGLTLEDRVPGHIGETEIAGFCRNFNYAPLQQGIGPFAFYVFGSHGWREPGTLFVRTREGASIKEVMETIRATLSSFDPQLQDDQIDIRFFDDTVQKHYVQEGKLSRLITLFTILAILISLMGVFGLVMFETEYRRKEIGVRRVHGASVGDILGMFNKRFLGIVLICFAIAAPVSWWIVQKYLEGFAYRMPVHAWVFCAALLAVLAVTVGVVTLRSLRAATANPVESLRTE